MDWSRFGLERPPFRPWVDATAYFPAASHEAARAALVSAFARREPAVLIDGGSGVGKSLVVRKWLDDLLPDVPRIYLPNTHAKQPVELLQAILFDLGKPYQNLSEQELRLALTSHLIDTAANGFPTVLVLDEAQNLGTSALEELRLLGNIESRQGSSTFAVLVAQPELRQALLQPNNSLLADRIAARCHIELLSVDESAAYLRHQLSSAGADPANILDPDAVAMIATTCGGNPRTLNRAASMAFELCALAESDVVDVEAALEALGRLGIAPLEEDETEEAIVLPHPARNEKPTQSDRRSLPATRSAKEKQRRKRSA